MLQGQVVLRKHPFVEIAPKQVAYLVALGNCTVYLPRAMKFCGKEVCHICSLSFTERDPFIHQP